MQAYLETMKQTTTYRRLSRQVQTAIDNEVSRKSRQLARAAEPFQPAIQMVSTELNAVSTRLQNAYSSMYADNQFHLKDIHEALQSFIADLGCVFLLSIRINYAFIFIKWHAFS